MAELITCQLPLNIEEYRRTIYISLPEGYDGKRKYPVIYMFDGESALAATAEREEWSFAIDKTIDGLIEENIWQGAIIVAIKSANEHSDLWRKYSYPRDNEYSFSEGSWIGWGDWLADWLVDTVKPYIDTNYETLTDADNTWLIGSSLSGTYVLWLALSRPQHFARVAAFSPGVSFYERADMQSYIKRLQTAKKADNLRVYLDVGTEENCPGALISNEQYVADVIDFFAKYLLTLGFLPGIDVNFAVHRGHNHTTEHWQQRLPLALCWLASV